MRERGGDEEEVEGAADENEKGERDSKEEAILIEELSSVDGGVNKYNNAMHSSSCCGAALSAREPKTPAEKSMKVQS